MTGEYSTRYRQGYVFIADLNPQYWFNYSNPIFFIVWLFYFNLNKKVNDLDMQKLIKIGLISIQGHTTGLGY